MLLKRAENKLLYFLGSSKENQDPSESQIIDGIAKKRRLSVIAQHRRLGETFCIDITITKYAVLSLRAMLRPINFVG